MDELIARQQFEKLLGENISLILSDQRLYDGILEILTRLKAK